ncbi:MAG: 2-C-methyl-D-erythritol 4-phosphate cytidylyltransferase [Oscillospiraceae bacterium]|jgi:2-C-methyl-D-erythritol 4-phosphate cytidylyltransferase|nr:2-C-methyl-D-erythritol 4-phosphate cytidylyltransferase [Oscillospiraceae bacterium]
MPRPPFVSAVIAAAGKSRRFGEDKLLAPLGGVSVLARTLSAFQSSPHINEIILVCSEGREDEFIALGAVSGITKLTRVVAGGYTRTDSVKNGVFAASKKAGLIAVHDGARPLVAERVISAAVEKARRYHAAVPAVKVKATIKRVAHGYVDETLDREELYEAQTPQVFEANLLKAALTAGGSGTDEASLVEKIGATVHISEGSYRNIKITTRDDLLAAEAFLGADE